MLQDMHKVKEVMEQRRQRMTVNGNETRAQRPAAAHCQSLPLAADNVNEEQDEQVLSLNVFQIMKD